LLLELTDDLVTNGSIILISSYTNTTESRMRNCELIMYTRHIIYIGDSQTSKLRELFVHVLEYIHISSVSRQIQR